ncbi:MAG: hypothetical protein J7L39_00185 [Candidatus Aenigmarchaeota archaeon]|nr:hypothetical protein [Candidatus Aenigmarchaeota archaeon]
MKGISFTLIMSFLLLILVEIVFLQRSLISYSFEEIGIKNKIFSLKNFYESIIEDAKNAMDIAGKRAISSAISYVITNGVGMDDAKLAIEELMVNGTLYGNPENLLEGSTLKDWRDKIEYVASRNGYILKLKINSFEIRPFDSFNLEAVLNISINLTDANKVARIERSTEIMKKISIENFEDPLYPLNTLGRLTSVIKKSPHLYSHFSIDQLMEDLNNTYYHPSLNGASFLDRLEGVYFVQEKYRSLAENVIGLESFVDKEKILSVGLPIQEERSNLDYLYFSGATAPAFKISGMPETFRLDNETTINNLTHLQLYNVTGKVIE